LKVLQLNNSDIIDIGYSANDAGIAYNTLDILNEVFARQYQQIRFGETNNVIRFFEKEVARLYKILTNAEDDLIRYNISKRIINYGEQTKQLTILEAQQQNFRNDQLMNYTTAKALLDYLERQLGNRAQVIRANQEFTNQVKDISRIQSRISNLRLMSSEGGGRDNESQEELAKAQRDLQAATGRVTELTKDIEASTYSTETGVKANDMLSRWLEQLLLLEKTKAEMTATDILNHLSWPQTYSSCWMGTRPKLRRSLNPSLGSGRSSTKEARMLRRRLSRQRAVFLRKRREQLERYLPKSCRRQS
jgi:hypothetical protein